MSVSRDRVYRIGMGRWNPWSTLAASPWLTLQYGILPRGQHGRIEGTPEGGFLITLDQRLDRVERRCTLGHEIAHAELNMLWPEGTAGHLVMRGEHIVNRLVAERMVPEDELRLFVKRFIDLGEMCLARDVCEEWDVTVDVADLALRAFEDKVREHGLIERARMSA